MWTPLKGTVKLVGWVNSHWCYTENALENISEPQWVKKQSMHFESCTGGEYRIFLFLWWKILLEEMLKLERTCRRRAGGRQTLKSSSGCLGNTPVGGGTPFAGRWRGFCLEPDHVWEVLPVKCGWSHSDLLGLKYNYPKLQTNTNLPISCFSRL